MSVTLTPSTHVTASIARARTLMTRTRAESFAVGAFNVDNFDTMRAVCRAARATAARELTKLGGAGQLIDNAQVIEDSVAAQVEEVLA